MTAQEDSAGSKVRKRRDLDKSQERSNREDVEENEMEEETRVQQSSQEHTLNSQIEVRDWENK